MSAISANALTLRLTKVLLILLHRPDYRTQRFNRDSQQSACFSIFSSRKGSEQITLLVVGDTLLERHLELTANAHWCRASRPCPGSRAISNGKPFWQWSNR